ncbi:MAG: glycosyltransferase [Hyphomicrobium sp.]
MAISRCDVIQSTAWYPPYHRGGTETYVEGLVHGLKGMGIESRVVIPRGEAPIDNYEHAGALVQTYPVNDAPEPRELRENRPHSRFEAFRTLMASAKGAIYHQHSWTRGCGLNHLKCAHELGLPTIVTVHVPGCSCVRGTMMQFGHSQCDGRIDDVRCAACSLQGRGMPKALAHAASRIPIQFSQRAGGQDGRMASAIAARAFARQRRTELKEMFENADRVVAVCEWLYVALSNNGAPEKKLKLSRQGVSREFLESARRAQASQPKRDLAPLKVIFVGRWDPVKGVDVLVRAVRALPKSCNVTVTLHAIARDEEALRYRESVRAWADGDARIIIADPVEHGALANVLAQHDVLAAPSVWLETGPLVVLEAQAVGLYVLGSRLGGIAELIGDREAGELVAPFDVASWSAAISRLADAHVASPRRLRSRTVRTMETVAAEMAAEYEALRTRR